MSNDTVTSYLAEHPKLNKTLILLVVLLSQVGIVSARDATFPGP